LDTPLNLELFISGADSNSAGAYIDPRYPATLPRIGDYTSTDCNGDVGWAAWTDTRNGTPEIWTARIPLDPTVIPVTITSNPTGQSFTADGASYVSPQTFQWYTGSIHIVDFTTAPQPSGVRSSFLGWSDGTPAASRNIVVGSAPASYAANLATQYLLTENMDLQGGGTLTASPSSPDGFYTSGTVVQLTAAPVTGYRFLGYSGALSGTKLTQSVTMSAPETVTASFASSAPTLPMPTVFPTTIVAGVPTLITVTVAIQDPALLPTGINLLQVGSTTITLGTFNDSGINGDLAAGDQIYTAQATVTIATVGQLQLEVSASFQGLLKRSTVNAPVIYVQSASAPMQSITALAQALMAGNTATALSYVVPSANNSDVINGATQAELSSLASVLMNAQLVSTQPDLRTFEGTVTTPSGPITREFSMVAGPSGQWLVNTW